MNAAITTGVADAGAKLVFADNLYMYGPNGRCAPRDHAPARHRPALDHPAHYRLMFIQRPDDLLGHGPAEEQTRIESLGALAALAADAPAVRDGQADPVAMADAIWASMHGIAALVTGVAIFDRERALAATEASIAMLQWGLHG